MMNVYRAGRKVTTKTNYDEASMWVAEQVVMTGDSFDNFEIVDAKEINFDYEVGY